MTTMTLNITNPGILDRLKDLLSSMSGVEITSISNNATKHDEAANETEYICSSPQMLEILKEGDNEIVSGKGTPMKLEDLWN